MTTPLFLDLPNADPPSADVLLLPLPYEATACYGKGTANGPRAIWEASTHIELWDEELDFDLEELQYHSAEPLRPDSQLDAGQYLLRVFQEAQRLHRNRGLVIGVGGEHSVTPPLVAAAADEPQDTSPVTVVQFDAHADLRDTYQGTPHSHACAMRRVVEKGASVIAIGVRSAERAEYTFGRQSGRVRTFLAGQLEGDDRSEQELLTVLSEVCGPVYLSIDVDALEVSLSPATGTPQPGGLGWWQTLRYLRRLLYENRNCRLIGCDIVETVPRPGTKVNEFIAAKLLLKVIAYRFGRQP